jgi:hypothetical protein
VGEKLLRVDCYAGYQGDQRPVRIWFEKQMIEIGAVEGQWYSPGATYFQVWMTTGERYLLRHDTQDRWTLEAFRATKATKRFVDTKFNGSV